MSPARQSDVRKLVDFTQPVVVLNLIRIIVCGLHLLAPSLEGFTLNSEGQTALLMKIVGSCFGSSEVDRANRFGLYRNDVVLIL